MIHIELRPELDAQIAAWAQARGLALEQYIIQRLEEYSISRNPGHSSVNEAIDRIQALRRGNLLGRCECQRLDQRRPQVLMAAFVADASVTLPWCFDDAATTWRRMLPDRLREEDTVIVPAHWATEVSNGPLTAARTWRIEPGRGALSGRIGFAADLCRTGAHVDTSESRLRPR